MTQQTRPVSWPPKWSIIHSMAMKANNRPPPPAEKPPAVLIASSLRWLLLLLLLSAIGPCSGPLTRVSAGPQLGEGIRRLPRDSSEENVLKLAEIYEIWPTKVEDLKEAFRDTLEVNSILFKRSFSWFLLSRYRGCFHLGFRIFPSGFSRFPRPWSDLLPPSKRLHFLGFLWEYF